MWEWGMKVYRLHAKQKRLKDEREFQMELSGQLMALIANVNRDPKKKATPFTREDFFKLSYDKAETETEALSPEDKFKKVKEQLGSRIKKDGDK